VNKAKENIAVGPPTRAGERSERLRESCCNLLLESLGAVARKAVERWAIAERAADLELAQEFLASVFVIRQAPPDARRKLVEHPSFRYWLKALRRVSRGDQPDRERELLEAGPGFAWPLELAAGSLTRSWRTKADDRGGLRVAPWSCHLEFGPERARLPVTVESQNGDIAFRWRDGATQVLPAAAIVEGALPGDAPGVEIRPAPRLGETQVVCSARDEYLRVDLTGTNQRATGVNFFGTRDELYLDSPDLSVYEAALTALRMVWLEQYSDLDRFTKVIVPMRSSADSYRAFTVSSRQGAIFLDQIPAETLVENIIHENAHIKLRQIELLGSLLVDPNQDQPRFSVPWRPDPRPIPGIVEGLWVFSHIAEYRLRLCARLQADVLKERFDEQMRDLRSARDILGKEARFTELGSEYFEAMSAWIDELTERGR